MQTVFVALFVLLATLGCAYHSTDGTRSMTFGQGEVIIAGTQDIGEVLQKEKVRVKSYGFTDGFSAILGNLARAALGIVAPGSIRTEESSGGG